MLEDIYFNLNEKEDIIMEDSREEHWRYIAEVVDNMSNIHALRWDIYIK